MKYFLVTLLFFVIPYAAFADATAEFKAANQTMHEGMMGMAYTGDVDTDFVRGMIPHHQGAVDMAKVVLKYGTDEEAREFAKWIIYIQEQEILQMKHWLTRFGVPEGEKVAHYNEDAVAEFDAQMHQMHQDMHINYTGNADVDMMRGMIPHHQAAIDMAYTQKKYGKHPALEDLVQGIVVSQSSEIAFMKRWLAKHAPSGIMLDASDVCGGECAGAGCCIGKSECCCKGKKIPCCDAKKKHRPHEH